MDFDLRACMDEVLELVLLHAQNWEKGLNLSIADNVPAKLNGDLIRLSQVLTNLLVNVVKLSNAEDLNLQITTGEEIEETVTLLFEVTISAIGLEIPGVELAMCQKLVKIMAGEIGVENTESNGARFWLKVPFKRQTDANTPDRPIEKSPRPNSLIEAGAKLHALPHEEDSFGYLVDLNHLIQMCEGHRPAMISAIDRFIEYAPSLVDSIEQAIAEVDTYTLGKHALFLEGSSATIGIQSIQAIAGQLKRLAFKHSTDGCLSLVAELKNSLRALREQRDEIFHKLKQTLASPSTQASKIFGDPCKKLIKILLVDDDRMTLTLLKARLQQLPNYLVTTATSGEEAWNQVSENSFDIIVSDWSMPDISGIILCQRLKFCRPEPSADARFILLTVHSDPQYEKIAREAGVDDFIVKPVNPEDLRKKIAALTLAEECAVI